MSERSGEMQDKLEPGTHEAENRDGLAAMAILIVTVALIILVVAVLL